MIPRLSVTSLARLQTGELARAVLLVVAVPVFDDVDARGDRAALLETGLRPIGLARTEIDKKVKLPVRAIAKNGHVSLL